MDKFYCGKTAQDFSSIIIDHNIIHHTDQELIIITQGVGEGGSRGLCPRTFKSAGGAQVGLCPHFWTDQVFLFCYFFHILLLKMQNFLNFTLLKFVKRI